MAEEVVVDETISETTDSEVEEVEVNLDDIADTAIEVLREILSHFDVGDITIDEYEGDDEELILDITGSDLGILIGRYGRTLDAIQFLVSTITYKKLGYRYPVVIDVEGYKSRQRQKLEAIAKNSANKAVNQKRNISLKPMTPYERRIIHITLADDSRVETISEGEGSARYVIVVPH